jgi:hypothetical protein
LLLLLLTDRLAAEEGLYECSVLVVDPGMHTATIMEFASDQHHACAHLVFSADGRYLAT